MSGARSYMTKIWRQPSWIGCRSGDASFTSTDPPDGPVISSLRRSCLPAQNGSEFPELAAQNFRNPQPTYWLRGVRYTGGATLIRAFVRNLRAWLAMPREKAQMDE